MATKYLSGTYSAGYTLSAAYNGVTLGGTGSIGGTGLIGNAAYDTVANLGKITSTGTTGITLRNGGTVSNGSTSDATAVVSGTTFGVYGATNVTNYGTIVGSAFSGVDIGANGFGSITNASAGLITGANGIRTLAPFVSNAGGIIGTNGVGVIAFGNGGALLNNTGYIKGVGVSSNGVLLNTGTLINGSSSSTVGLIEGGDGVVIQNGGTVINLAQRLGRRPQQDHQCRYDYRDRRHGDLVRRQRKQLLSPLSRLQVYRQSHRQRRRV